MIFFFNNSLAINLISCMIYNGRHGKLYNYTIVDNLIINLLLYTANNCYFFVKTFNSFKIPD
jgi:hypothetical protein